MGQLNFVAATEGLESTDSVEKVGVEVALMI